MSARTPETLEFDPGRISIWSARVVRDRDGGLYGRTAPGEWAYLGDNCIYSASELEHLYGPLAPVLDADGLPVVRTVGDLTARHIGRRVWVETDRTLPDRVRLLREIATASNEAVRLTLEVPAHPEWFLMAHFDLDTPVEVLP